MRRNAVHAFGLKSVTRSATVWSPWFLGASLVAWWSAESLVDGAVTTWTSRVGGFAPTQAVAGLKPTRSATAFNSLYPGVTFDGTADELTLAGTTGLPVAGTEGEIWFVGSWVSSASTSAAIAYGGVGAGQRNLRKVATTNLGNVTDGAVSASGASVAGNHILGGFFGATAMNGRVDGVAFGPTSITLNTGTTRLRLGANTAGTAANFFNSVFAEALITTGLLSAADRERIEGFWAWRYGLVDSLPANHTYKEVRPVA